MAFGSRCGQECPRSGLHHWRVIFRIIPTIDTPVRKPYCIVNESGREDETKRPIEHIPHSQGISLYAAAPACVFGAVAETGPSHGGGSVHSGQTRDAGDFHGNRVQLPGRAGEMPAGAASDAGPWRDPFLPEHAGTLP